MKYTSVIIISLLIYVIFFNFKVYAFDVRDYFNYDILRQRLDGAQVDFRQSGFNVQNQEIFIKLSNWLYENTGINLQKIWLDASGLLVSILRWIADILVSIR